MYTIEMVPIGFVHSPITEKVDKGWGKVVSTIVLEPSFHGGTMGLTGFSHAIIVTHLHESAYQPESNLQRRPRERADLPLTGIFAQRAKDRPNGIGITTVEIIASTSDIVTVRGLDAIDGTPVLDIKPYVPAYDSATNTRVPDWMDVILHSYFTG